MLFNTGRIPKKQKKQFNMLTDQPVSETQASSIAVFNATSKTAESRDTRNTAYHLLKSFEPKTSQTASYSHILLRSKPRTSTAKQPRHVSSQRERRPISGSKIHLFSQANDESVKGRTQLFEKVKMSDKNLDKLLQSGQRRNRNYKKFSVTKKIDEYLHNHP